MAPGELPSQIARPIAGSAEEGRAFYGSKDAMVECDHVTITIGGAISAPTTTVGCVIGSQTKQIDLTSTELQFGPVDASSSTNEPVQPSLDGYVFHCLGV